MGRKPATTNPRQSRTELAPVDRPVRRARRRMTAVTIVILAFVGVCIGVSAYLQLAQQEVFRNEAQRNYQRSVVLDDRRGNIFDRHGALLATSVDAESVYAIPERVERQSETAALLAEVLDMPPEKVFKKIISERKFIYIRRKVAAEVGRRVRDLDLPGIGTLPESKRYYPKRETAGQVVGMVGMDPVGLEGVERSYDEYLRGRSLRVNALRDARGRIVFTEPLPAAARFAGHDVVLTIDERLQSEVERIVEKTVITNRALNGIAIVVDVPTGEILALANVPRFNPNNFVRYPLDRRRNRAVSDAFEPGSTFKVFTLAAAIEQEAITLDDVVDVEHGRMRIGPYVIHDTHPYDMLSVWDIVKYSSNIGMTKVAQAVGRKGLYNTLTDFGFGQTPESGLVGETAGQVRPLQEWAGVTFANIAFGQGVSVSALQLVMGVAALGNEGRRLKPQIVREIRAADGTVIRHFGPQLVCQVVRPEVAHKTIQAMMRVVEPGGTGEAAAIDRYPVAGKTGTAQKPDTLVGGYSPFRWIASFVGVVPANAPRLAILVVIDEPMGKAYGGTVSAPAWREIAEWALQYYEIAPPGQHLARQRAAVTMADAERPTEVAATGGANAPVSEAETEAPLLSDDIVYVPDFRGLSISQVRKLARAQRLHISYRDGGLAVSQSVPASSRVEAWSVVEVRFEPSWGEHRQEVRL